MQLWKIAILPTLVLPLAGWVSAESKAKQSPEAAAVAKRVAELGGKVDYDKADPGKIVAIDLSGAPTTDADLKLFATQPNLQKLWVEGAEIHDEGVKHILGLKKLKDLMLFNTEITEASVAALPALTELQSLNLRRSTYLDDAALVHLKKLPKLRYLSLLYNNFTDEGMKHLKDLDLVMLDLRGVVQLSDAGLEPIGNLTNLKKIMLRTFYVTDAGLDSLKNLKGLKSIVIEDTSGITDAGVAKIAEYFPGLEEIDLFRCSAISDDGMKALAGIKELQRIKLRGSPVTGAALVHFKDLEKLEFLDLSECATVGDAGMENLQGLKNLARLDLWQTTITNEGLKNIAGLEKLNWLSLKGTPITDAGLAQLKGLKNLATLNLEETETTDAGLEHLAGLKGLKALSLKYTKTTDAGAKKLQAAIPGLKIAK